MSFEGSSELKIRRREGRRKGDERSLKPLAATILVAWSAMLDMSIYREQSSGQLKLRRDEGAERRKTHTVDVLSSSLSGEHGEDTSSTSNLEVQKFKVS